ncbi:MAG: ribosome silencing factor [Prevotella sp.]|nr:ribosome silencing factor [Prevotella sp.]
MNTAKELVETAVKGIQEKKGKKIKIVDLTGIDGGICQYFVICEGNSPSQVDAIAESVEDMLRIELKEKPVHTVGKENSLWVAMDYVDIMVHIFMPEAHEFYNLENLWQDAPIEEIEDLD